MPTTSARDNAFVIAAASFALTSVAIFAMICMAAQFARPDLDPAAAPLSFYLVGRFGAIVRAAYYLLAAGLIAFGCVAYRASDARLRSALPMQLFVAAGLALAPVAASAPLGVDGAPHAELARFVHGVAAQATFLSVTVAMLLQSWRWWNDAAFASGRRFRLLLAATAFAALWVNALARVGPRGAMQKGLIVLILVWLAGASWRVLRVLRSPPA